MAGYSGPLGVYQSRFPAMSGLSQAFVATTDTMVRSFMGTFSALAKHYHLYMIGSGPITPFHQSGRARDMTKIG